MDRAKGLEVVVRSSAAQQHGLLDSIETDLQKIQEQK
jgi:hypothetical protein